MKGKQHLWVSAHVQFQFGLGREKGKSTKPFHTSRTHYGSVPWVVLDLKHCFLLPGSIQWKEDIAGKISVASWFAPLKWEFPHGISEEHCFLLKEFHVTIWMRHFSIVSPFKNANEGVFQKEIPSCIHHFSLRAVVLGAVPSFYLLSEMHGDFN